VKIKRQVVAPGNRQQEWCKSTSDREGAMIETMGKKKIGLRHIHGEKGPTKRRGVKAHTGHFTRATDMTKEMSGGAGLRAQVWGNTRTGGVAMEGIAREAVSGWGTRKKECWKK